MAAQNDFAPMQHPATQHAHKNVPLHHAGTEQGIARMDEHVDEIDRTATAHPSDEASEILYLNEALEHKNQMLRERTMEYEALFEGAGAGIGVIDAETGRFLRASHRLCQILNHDRDALLSMEFGELAPLQAKSHSAFAPLCKTSGNCRMEDRYLRADGVLIWVDATITAIRDEKGHPVRFLFSVQDISERKRTERERILLVRELHHRLGNNLQVLSSIALLSEGACQSTKDFVDRFRARIAALSTSVDLAFKCSKEGANLNDLFSAILGSLDAKMRSRIFHSICDVYVGPSDLQTMALVVHELAENAIRHGSLAHQEGRVNVSTRRLAGHPHTKTVRVRLDWHETGTGPARKPDRMGFGMKFLSHGVLSGHDATAEFKWSPEGMQYTLTLNLEAASTDNELALLLASPDGLTSHKLQKHASGTK